MACVVLDHPKHEHLLRETGKDWSQVRTEPLNDGEPFLTMGMGPRNRKRIDEFCKSGRLIYMDHAYWERGYDLGNFRLCVNNIYQDYLITNAPHDRLKMWGVEFKDEPRGDAILVLPPPRDFDFRFGVKDWVAHAKIAIRKFTDRPIIVRHKNPSPIEDDFKKAWAVVSYATAAEVEAILWGLPVWTERGPARPLSFNLDEIEAPVIGPREQWAASLSYGQFTKKERENGYALETAVAVLSGLRRAGSDCLLSSASFDPAARAGRRECRADLPPNPGQ